MTSNLVTAARELLRLKDLKTDAEAMNCSGDWAATRRQREMLEEHEAKKGAAWDALRRALHESAAETKALQYPFAWARRVVAPVFDEPDHDYDLVAQESAPPGDGWLPLYREPYKHRVASSKDLRDLLTRACNFITSNYFEGDLPAFDKPDALLAEIHAVLDGADSSEKTAGEPGA